MLCCEWTWNVHVHVVWCLYFGKWFMQFIAMNYIHNVNCTNLTGGQARQSQWSRHCKYRTRFTNWQAFKYTICSIRIDFKFDLPSLFFFFFIVMESFIVRYFKYFVNYIYIVIRLNGTDYITTVIFMWQMLSDSTGILPFVWVSIVGRRQITSFHSYSIFSLLLFSFIFVWHGTSIYHLYRME